MLFAIYCWIVLYKKQHFYYLEWFEKYFYIYFIVQAILFFMLFLQQLSFVCTLNT